MREEARSSGNRPDRSVFQKMNADRDEQLKAIFSAEQFKRYKVEVEPSMRAPSAVETEMEAALVRQFDG